MLKQSDPIASAADFAAAEEICRQRLPDFHFAFRFLPRRKRNAAQTVLAFSAMVREAIVGNCGGEGCDVRPATAAGGGACCSADDCDARAELVKQRLSALYAQAITLPAPAQRSPDEHVLAAMLQVIEEHGIPEDLFTDLAEGCLAEAKSLRVATWEALRKRLGRTAGATGSAVAGLLGVQHSDARRWFTDLAAGMALARMLAVFKDRLSAGKVDWPAEDLVAAGCPEPELLRAAPSAAVRALVGLEVTRARGLLHAGAEGIGWLAADGSRLSAAVATEIHHGILNEIERAGFNPFSRRFEMTTLWRWGRIPAAWKLARRQQGG